MDSIKKSSHPELGGANMDRAQHTTTREEGQGMSGKEHNITESGSSLSDSGCPQSPGYYSFP